MTHPEGDKICPFKLVTGRENMKVKNVKEKYKNKVDHKEFLPNSVVHSPAKKIHSQTAKTMMLGLYPMSKILPNELM